MKAFLASVSRPWSRYGLTAAAIIAVSAFQSACSSDDGGGTGETIICLNTSTGQCTEAGVSCAAPVQIEVEACSDVEAFAVCTAGGEGTLFGDAECSCDTTYGVVAPASIPCNPDVLSEAGVCCAQPSYPGPYKSCACFPGETECSSSLVQVPSCEI
jgi:hypothetical protein